MSLAEGVRLGSFLIEGPIGSGGMGEVYRALDTRLDRHVAIKVLPAVLAGKADYRSRLEREAKILARINHPNICTLHELGEEQGVVYLVFECLEGKTLQEHMQRGALPLDEVVTIGMEIADALDAAHSKGVVHRDIKPPNIFITRSGHAKVLDFGLATYETDAVMIASVATVSFKSISGTTVGTAGYMSPEQVLGRELDGRSDLFSLGIVLYRAATGSSPFRGATVGELSDAILHKAPVPPSRVNPAIPPALEQVILKALEKDPELRYRSAADMRADLRRVKRDSESSIEVPVAAPTFARSRTKWLALGSVLALLAVVGVVAAVWHSRSPASLARAPSLRQLTANPAEAPLYTAAISPDGKHLAYSDPNGFYIRLLETGETNPLKLPPGFCFR
ncbi:MAG TPA: serine/threonine-protein kinase [Terriglobales bacterium]